MAGDAKDFASMMMDEGGVRSAAEAAQVRGWVDSGNYALNWAMSDRFLRGWPLGHMAEIFGDSSTGKSFVVARAIAAVQAMGGFAVLDDTEGALNPKFIEKKLGVDASRLLYTRSTTVKDHFDLLGRTLDIWDKAAEGAPLLIALDSLALLTTEHELEVGLDKPSLTRAKEIRAMLRQKGKSLHDRPILYLVANHTIANVGAAFFESDTTTPGGGGPKFESSVRLSMRTPKKLKAGKGRSAPYEGVVVRAVVDKNRLAPPWREASMTIPFDRPIDPYSGLLDALLSLDFDWIETKGPNVYVDGQSTGVAAYKTDALKQSESAAEILSQYPDLLERADAELEAREDSAPPVRAAAEPEGAGEGS